MKQKRSTLTSKRSRYRALVSDVIAGCPHVSEAEAVRKVLQLCRARGYKVSHQKLGDRVICVARKGGDIIHVAYDISSVSSELLIDSPTVTVMSDSGFDSKKISSTQELASVLALLRFAREVE